MLYRKFESIMLLKHETENNHFVPYVFLDKVFSIDEINKINSLWNDALSEEAMVFMEGNAKAVNYEQRLSKKMYIPAEINEWIYNKLGAIGM